MAVFLSRASQQYAARQNPYVVTATIPAGVTVNSVKVSLTRESWPAGPVGVVTLTFPDGSPSGFSFDGGDITNKDGSPKTVSSCQFERGAFDGSGNFVQSPFPVGTYTLSFQVLQTITTAVTVERF